MASYFSLLILSLTLLSIAGASNVYLPSAPQKPSELYADAFSLFNSSVRVRIIKAVKEDTVNDDRIRSCGGRVDYGEPIDGDTNNLALWRASWMKAQITYPMLKLASAKWLGSGPYNNISPPGFVQDVDSRGHLLAKSLGGSGLSVKNIVAMEINMNSPLMAQYEQEVASIYQTISIFCGVQYTVTARYENNASQRPDKVEIDVQIYLLTTPEIKTLWLNAVLNNLLNEEIAGLEPGQSPNRLISLNAPRQVPDECKFVTSKLLSNAVRKVGDAVQLLAAIQMTQRGRCT